MLDGGCRRCVEPQYISQNDSPSDRPWESGTRRNHYLCIRLGFLSQARGTVSGTGVLVSEFASPCRLVRSGGEVGDCEVVRTAASLGYGRQRLSDEVNVDPPIPRSVRC